MYLKEKGYSGIDGQADKAPAAAGSWDWVPPEERAGTWTALLPPRERERLLGRQLRVNNRRGPSHIRRPLSDSDCVICPLEEVSRHRRPRDGTGESPGRTIGRSATYRDYHWQREALDRDTSLREGVTTWRWESGRWQRESCSRRREWPDDLREREGDRSQERPLEARARIARDRSGQRKVPAT